MFIWIVVLGLGFLSTFLAKFFSFKFPPYSLKSFIPLFLASVFLAIVVQTAFETTDLFSRQVILPGLAGSIGLVVGQIVFGVRKGTLPKK